MLIEDVIKLAGEIINKDTLEYTKTQKNIESINEEIEKINSNIKLYENQEATKKAYAKASAKLEELKTKRNECEKAYKSAEAQRERLDDLTRKINLINSKMPKYDELKSLENSLKEKKQSFEKNDGLLKLKQQEITLLEKEIDEKSKALEEVKGADLLAQKLTVQKEEINKKAETLKELKTEITREDSAVNIIPKVEKLLEVYYDLPSPKAKNDMLKDVLEKVVYTKKERSKKGNLDNFDIAIYPKIPKYIT